jgi:putative transposase
VRSASDRAVDAAPGNRAFEASAPNRKWIADFTYVWPTEGWLYVAVVIDLFSRRVVGWSMSAAMMAQLVSDALVMAIWDAASPMRYCITPIAAANASASNFSGSWPTMASSAR